MTLAAPGSRGITYSSPTFQSARLRNSPSTQQPNDLLPGNVGKRSFHTSPNPRKQHVDAETRIKNEEWKKRSSEKAMRTGSLIPPTRAGRKPKPSSVILEGVESGGGKHAFGGTRPRETAVGRKNSELEDDESSNKRIAFRERPSRRTNSDPDNAKTTSTNAEDGRKQKEHWQLDKAALEKKFGEEGWNPRKKLSPDAVEGVRQLHASDPDKFTTPVLAEHFEVSPEAIKRILKSKWRPSQDEMEDKLARWERRGARLYEKLVEAGVKPPKKWREMGVGRSAPGEKPKWKKKTKPESSIMAADNHFAERYKQHIMTGSVQSAAAPVTQRII